MNLSTIFWKIGKAYGLHNGQWGCGEVGVFPPALLPIILWTGASRCCKKGDPLAYFRSSRKVCGFAQGKAV